MFPNKKTRRILHIFSNIFISFVWGWILYVQYQTTYHTPFEAGFQKVYMIALWSFIVIAVGRAVYHYVKLKEYSKVNAERLMDQK